MKVYTLFILIKAMSRRAQNCACISSAERELPRPKAKSVLAEKNKIGTWFLDQMERNLGTLSRWMTNKEQPSVEHLYDIVQHHDVGVRELLLASKKMKYTEEGFFCTENGGVCVKCR